MNKRLFGEVEGFIKKNQSMDFFNSQELIYDEKKWNKLSGYLIKLKGLNNIAEEKMDEAQELIREVEKTLETPKRIYIPTLRGLKTFKNNKDIFLDRTEADYFKDDEFPFGEEENDYGVFIFTGLDLYNKLQEMLLGEFEEKNKLENFEEFLNVNFFDGKKIHLLAPKSDDVVHIKIGDDQDFPIYQLGDGIQSIIILTFPLFANPGKNILIGIEEPEIYLHPGMQRKLMEVLLDKDGKYGFENFQYLITTHSNHFLDLTLDYPEDVLIYESRKLEDGKFEINRKNDDNMLALMENLGVRNSSVFLANSTIWVEGITDRLYLKKYMEVYQREMFKKGEIKKVYEEDKHYSFIEYSGGNITHWDFLDEKVGMKSSQISNNIFLLGDTDGHRDKTTQIGKKLRKASG